LRELNLSGLESAQLAALCEPPHSWQLDTVALAGMNIDATCMRALCHVPSLTALEHGRIMPDAWPLLSRLPLLQRLAFQPAQALTTELTSSLCASLSQCKVLTDLSFHYVGFDDAATVEQIRAQWGDILRSVHNVRRLRITQPNLGPLLVALPVCMPLLEHLTLCSADDVMHADALLALVSHPSVQQLQLRDWNVKSSEKRVRVLVRSKRLPKLEHISWTDIAQ
jgi:hypothetical protein